MNTHLHTEQELLQQYRNWGKNHIHLPRHTDHRLRSIISRSMPQENLIRQTIFHPNHQPVSNHQSDSVANGQVNVVPMLDWPVGASEQSTAPPPQSPTPYGERDAIKTQCHAQTEADFGAYVHDIEKTRPHQEPDEATQLRSELNQHYSDFQAGYNFAQDILFSHGQKCEHFTNQEDEVEKAQESRKNIEWVWGNDTPEEPDSKPQSSRPRGEDFWQGIAYAQQELDPSQDQAIHDFFEDRLDGHMAKDHSLPQNPSQFLP